MLELHLATVSSSLSFRSTDPGSEEVRCSVTEKGERGACLVALHVRDERLAQVASAGGSRTPRPRYLPIAEHGLIGDVGGIVARPSAVRRPPISARA